MVAVRRAVLATFLCAAPLFAASAQASTGMLEREALREALRQSAHAAQRRRGPAAAARAAARIRGLRRGELARIARSDAPERLLIGRARTRTWPPSPPGCAPRREPELLRRSARWRRPSLRRGRRGRTERRPARGLHRARPHRSGSRPTSSTSLDPTSGRRIKFTWAYDTVRAGEALATVGGGSTRIVS